MERMHMRLVDWREKYPNATMTVHNNCMEPTDCAHAEESYWECCEHSFREDTPNELCFDTQYIPLDLLSLLDLTQIYADEKSFAAISVADEHIPVLHLWWD